MSGDADGLEHLHRFVQGRRGSEGLRIEALHALGAQGHNDEALQTIRDRCAMAGQLATEGKVKEAESLLAPLAENKRIHRTELSAYARAQAHLANAQGDLVAARRWIETMKENEEFAR